MIWSFLCVVIGTILIMFATRQKTENQSKILLLLGIVFVFIGGILLGAEINQCSKFGIGIPINIQQNIPPWR